MPAKSEKEWVLKAFDVFGRRFLVVSASFDILAASRPVPGAPPQNAIGQKCFKALFNRSSPCARCAVADAMASQEPILTLDPYVGSQRGCMPCQYAFPIAQNDRIEAFASIDFDLPIRHGVEAELQKSNVFLRKLLASAVDAVIAADKKGRLLIFNAAASKILGYDPERALREIGITDLYPGDTAHDVMRQLRSDAHGGRGHLTSCRVDLLAKTGETIPIRLNAAIVYEEDREIATIGFFRDIREEIRIRAELEKAQLQLVQAEKMASLGMLAAGVAHEINNPVAIMMEEAGWIGDILDEREFAASPNLDELRRALKQINTQGRRCKAITQKLLAFARKNDSPIAAVDINQIVEEMVGLSLQRAGSIGVAVKTSLKPKLPAVRVSPAEMQQVLLNLINNALDALSGRGGTLRLSTRVGAGHVVIEVADDGPGISKADQTRIFDPFFTTKPVGKGTGLGLYICYFIVQTMGGTIQFKSRTGGGAVFTIGVPVGPDGGP
jgi:two-component system NtrC family sensor kinase